MAGGRWFDVWVINNGVAADGSGPRYTLIRLQALATFF